MAKRTAITRRHVRPAARRAAKAPAKTPQQPSRRAGASDDTPYHHGALRDALLEAAERVLERDGLAGLTLRAVVREAGGKRGCRAAMDWLSITISPQSDP